MSITQESELLGMRKVSEVVAHTLRQMIEHAQPGMTTKELDGFGARVLSGFGARSAPYLTYGFPGCTCISVGDEFCHGVPSAGRILKEGDLVNVDVSAELDGFWADNGASFVLGRDLNHHRNLVEASRGVLKKAINNISSGVKIAEIGRLMETEANKRGFKVVKNLGGHGVGRSLHEQPDLILNYKRRSDKRRFQKNSVVAIETFISTSSTFAMEKNDGWTMVGNRGGFMAQHEHTIVVTDGKPMILTEANGIY